MRFLSQRSWIVGAALLATGAQAAGYEKVVTWSGKYVGIGGAATSSVQGSESLYFNPAGLTSDGEKKWDASLNFSPTWAKFSGPVIKDGDTKEGNWKLLPIVGATLAYSVDPKWNVALGYYVAGGAQAEYSGIDPSSVSAGFEYIGPQTVKTDLKIMELALGGSYKINSNFSLGAAWRVAFVNAAFATYSPHPLSASSAATYLNLTGLTATKWNGFRLGGQYRSDDGKWGLGASLRSSLGFGAKGKVSGKAEHPANNANEGDIAEADVTVFNTFPLQVAVGGDWACGDKWHFFSEYVWTQYSKNKQLDFEGSFTLPALLGGTVKNMADTPIVQNWRDQHNVRLAAAYSGIENWPIRAAYIFTSAVVPKSSALASFPAPGIGNTFTLGTGHTVGRVELNGAVEYSFEKATVVAGEGTVGDYNVKAWGLHLGASMKF